MSSLTSAKLLIPAVMLQASVVQSARYASCNIEEDYRGNLGIYGQLVLKEEVHESTGRRLMTVSGVVHGTNSNT